MMTIGPAAMPAQVETNPAAPGAPPASADLFGGMIATLTLSAAQPLAVDGDGATLPGELPVAAGDEPTLPATEIDPGAVAGELLALSAALPAQARILVRKPGEAIEAKDAETSDGETEAEAEPGMVEAIPLAPFFPAPNTATASVPAAANPAANPQLAEALKTAAKPETDLAGVKAAPVKAEQPQVSLPAAPPSPELSKLLQPHAPEPAREAIRAMLAQIPPAAAGGKPMGEKPGHDPIAPELKPTAAPLLAAAPLPPLEIGARAETTGPAELPIEPDLGELVFERQLDLASGDEWLDDLARDISRTAGADGSPLRFRLNPEHLGSLKVEITQDRGGAAVRLTTDTEAARAIIADAQPRLLAEARAQGLRISEAHVDLGQQAPSGDPRRQADHQAEPQLRTARSLQDEPQTTEAGDGKPTGGPAERYA